MTTPKPFQKLYSDYIEMKLWAYWKGKAEPSKLTLGQHTGLKHTAPGYNSYTRGSKYRFYVSMKDNNSGFTMLFHAEKLADIT